MLVRLDRALDATLARRTMAACAEGPANVRMSHCEAGIATHCERHAGTRPRWPARESRHTMECRFIAVDAYCIHSANDGSSRSARRRR
jgi:hypothetical protein